VGTPQFLRGDIVLTRSDSLLGLLIRWFERRPNDRVDYNHVGVLVTGGIVLDAELIEALWRVRRGSLWNLYGPASGANRPEIAVYRLCALDASAGLRVAQRAAKYEGRRYAWWALLEHAADRVLTRWRGRETYLFRRLFCAPLVECSGLVLRVFQPERDLLPEPLFNVPPGARPNPDDIHDYLQRPGVAALIYSGVLGADQE
jgi:hypothetical protein